LAFRFEDIASDLLEPRFWTVRMPGYPNVTWPSWAQPSPSI